MIMSASEDFLTWEELKDALSQLLGAAAADDFVRVRQLLRETVIGYAPEGEIVDWIYQQRRLDR